MKLYELYGICRKTADGMAIYRTEDAFVNELFTATDLDTTVYYSDCEVERFKVDKNGLWHILVSDEAFF